MSEQRFLPAPEDTDRLGAELATTLTPGDIVALNGDLGAGKSALARAIIRSLATDPALDVPSPSFALVQPYDTPRGPVLHADLYRLADASEADELGLLDTPDAIILVEWPSRAPAIAEAATVTVTLDIPEDGVGRTVRIER
ncbi:tRNA (adenosine(37)-N6)-threonylcarbamoyltransferase complex ATPase subunit type 1 TsaE [Devosia albogilva]|uniref:tRNA threonylcarbamoyladenosine biosynthesis protein TsaE n=1 Tax=Devosia albogilva TaxID=429726 RepID=A0ABW5QJV4_9HYPH